MFWKILSLLRALNNSAVIILPKYKQAWQMQRSFPRANFSNLQTTTDWFTSPCTSRLCIATSETKRSWCEIKLNEPQISNPTPLSDTLSSPSTRNVNFVHCNASSKTVQPSVAWQMNVPCLTPLNKHWQAEGKEAVFSIHHSDFHHSNPLLQLDAGQRHDMLQWHFSKSFLPNT